MSHVQCSVVCSLQSGQTPVYSASRKGHAAVVQLLIENGADISIYEEVCIQLLHSLLLVK